MALEIKKTLEERGECGVGMMFDPTDMLERLKELGLDVTVQPTYRRMPPMIKKDSEGNPVDVLTNEKTQIGVVFYLNQS